MRLSNARRHISLILRIAHNYPLRYVISMDNSLARRSPKGLSLLQRVRVPLTANRRWLAAASEGMGMGSSSERAGKNGAQVSQEQDVPESIDLSFQSPETAQLPVRPEFPKIHSKPTSDPQKKFPLVRSSHSPNDQVVPPSKLQEKEELYEEEYDLTKNWPGLIKLIVCMAVSAWIGAWLAQWIRGAA